jgi:alpha-tubulin suppressor-like RCC1 family protein
MSPFRPVPGRPILRVALAFALILVAFASAAPVAAQTTPAGSAPPEDRRRGVVHDGLTRAARTGACRGKFELAHRDRVGGTTLSLCTHGPDAAPDGVDVTRPRPTAELVAAATETATANGTAAAQAPSEAGVVAVAAQAGIPCYGNGTDGYRVQVIYARASDVTDRYAALAPSLVQWSAAADLVVSASAAETGGVRHIRYVTDAGCNLVVERVTLSPAGDNDINATVSELRAKGFNRTDRKYLLYTDANLYCGIAQMYNDDTASAVPGVNANNGHAQVPGMVARVDTGCWGLSDSIEAHELMHNLGGVQESAPHVTPNGHCTDEYDLMCYVDGAGVVLQYVCPSWHAARADCNHDDYFSTNPAPGSYLATHWNTAKSAFLAVTEPMPDRVWGWNDYNQLGDGTATSRPTAVVNGLAGVDSVAAGGYHSLAVKSGTVWSWGLGHVGQLGRAGGFTSPTPGPVGGLSGVTAVSAGFYHSLALRTDGTVWAWGWNAYGQLGDGTTVDRTAPVQVSGLTNVVGISAGAAHNLAQRTDGSVWSWGLNSHGQLGRAAPAVSATPAVVPGAAGVTSISAGAYHSLAVKSGGAVASWGFNGYGQLGDGTFSDRAAPVTAPGLTGMKSVSAGLGHSLAVGTDGLVRSWGLGHVGQLGRSVVMAPSAALVPGLSGVAAVSAGGYHSLALRTTGTVAGWGWNALNQLGDGTTVDRLAPGDATGLVSVVSLSAGLAHNVVSGG